jgi:hypothetical protein
MVGARVAARLVQLRDDVRDRIADTRNLLEAILSHYVADVIPTSDS